MPVIVNHGHPLERSRQVRDHVEQVRPLVGSSRQPVHEGVAARLVVVEVDHADDVAVGGEIHLHRVVHATEGVPLHVLAVGTAGPDAGRLARVHHGTVAPHDLVALATVAPVEAAVRWVEEGAVDVGGVPGVLETADDHHAFVGDTVTITVGQLPDAGRRRDIERAIQPAGTLGEGHAVGEDGHAVEDAVAVGVLQQQHAVRWIGIQLFLRPVHPRGISDEEAAAIVEAAHDGVADDWRSGRDDELEAGGQVVPGNRRRGRGQSGKKKGEGGSAFVHGWAGRTLSIVSRSHSPGLNASRVAVFTGG